MRIISGAWRRRSLLSPSDQSIRPTKDRVKENLFNILEARIKSWDQISILDAFSGTGSLGLEALSRGVRNITFVEKHPEHLSLILKNLAHLSGEEKLSFGKNKKRKYSRNFNLDGSEREVELIQQGFWKFVQEQEKLFDLILMDPPYKMKIKSDQLKAVQEIMNEDAWLVLERSSKWIPPKSPTITDEPPLELFIQKNYGDTSLFFFSKDSEKERKP
jgi:16S rRNA (guanine(966)-N(2))-methyltransferase RsmD